MNHVIIICIISKIVSSGKLRKNLGNAKNRAGKGNSKTLGIDQYMKLHVSPYISSEILPGVQTSGCNHAQGRRDIAGRVN